MGTPKFAVPCLKSLIEAGHKIKCVVTQPDKPSGRGYKITYPEVKQCALDYGLEVFQPSRLRDDGVEQKLKSFDADVIVVVAYGKILPKYILDMPKYGCINVHGSLLPKYRGAAPIQWSVINGESKTGVTTMYMDETMDTGDIILKSETEIGANETSGELYDRLSGMGANLIVETIKKLEKGNVERIKQQNEDATYAPMLEKSMGKIDWNKSSLKIHNLIRGVNPWPIAHTKFKGKTLKIYNSEIIFGKGGKSGEIISVKPLQVACGDGNSIELKEVQLEGKKRMMAEDFARGYRIEVGAFFEME